jgi:PIN domain nuclease of toxin-antitoxin system
MARILLDTHAAVWWWTASPRLGDAAHQVLKDGMDDIWVSAASAFEIAIKHRLGKFDDIGDPIERFPRLMSENHFLSLDVTQAHALAAGRLAGAHADPFDRLIAAQAIAENLTVITRDPEFTAFGCKVLW